LRREEELEGDELAEVAMEGGVDDAHAALAEGAGDLVLAEDDVAGLEGGQGCAEGGRVSAHERAGRS
jgi:hypothetical protein